MMLPVCVNCKMEMPRMFMGIQILELDFMGEPYQLYTADVHQCPKCLFKVTAGQSTITPRYDPKFQAELVVFLKLEKQGKGITIR